MVDLHCHILPDMDDGARESEEAIAMARLALDRGTTRLVATPHCRTGGAEQVLKATDFLRQQLQCLQLPMKIYAGMEIFVTRETPRLLREGKLLTLNNSRYPLVEFDFEDDKYIPVLHQLVEAGYCPVVAHPERYRYIQQDPRILNEWIDMGCLLQLNKASLSGYFGSTCRELALALVARGYAGVVASDAHGCERRTPRMSRTWDILCRNFSPHTAEVLLQENPRRILRNEPVRTPHPHRF